ncbi:MAG: DivIVA domain-containing protein [Balneolaceae bacterium]|nr:DivIVA domain-containing protein [Balneolaceae bacterium]
MKLTALEIKQQKFEKSLRGYDTAEVQAFLNLMSNEWEHMVTKNRELQQQIDNLQEKLKHYERVEEALHETLQAAKESAETKLHGARKDAKNKIEKAEMKAEAIINEAKQERREVRQSILRLLDRRKEIIGGIRSYLEVARESVDQFDKDEAQLFDRPSEFEERDNIDFERSDETETSNTNEKKNTSTSSGPAKDTTAPPPGTEDMGVLVDDLELKISGRQILKLVPGN